MCEVSPFTYMYDALQNVEVCAAATAWYHPDTAQSYILEIIKYYGLVTSYKTHSLIQIRVEFLAYLCVMTCLTLIKN